MEMNYMELVNELVYEIEDAYNNGDIKNSFEFDCFVYDFVDLNRLKILNTTSVEQFIVAILQNNNLIEIIDELE